MRNDLTDADVLTFALAGCNAAEIAAYAGVPESVALLRMTRLLRDYAAIPKRDRLTLREAA